MENEKTQIKKLLIKSEIAHKEAYANSDDNDPNGISRPTNKRKQAWSTRYYKQAKKIADQIGITSNEIIEMHRNIITELQS